MTSTRLTQIALLTLLLPTAAGAWPAALAQTPPTRQRLYQMAKRPPHKGPAHSLSLHLTDDLAEPVMLAHLEVRPMGLHAVTDLEGNARIDDLPDGTWTLVVTYVGMEPIERPIDLHADVHLDMQMRPTSLQLDEVSVTARRNDAGEATSSTISRQAIDHLQATSLADVMQLIPGQLMGNTDLTSQSNLQLRTLVNNNTSAFGSSVVMDGVPMSNNGALSHGGFSSTAFVGTDLRQISADDIDEVEVIRGIPSAEYGDLTSGMMVVKTKVGVTPWQVKAKINPGTQNYSLGKGLRLGRWGTVNYSLDYAKAWGDPRQKTRSFDRYTGSLAWGCGLGHGWDVTTKLRFALGKDWSGNDPDAISDGTYTKARNQTLSLSHNGKVNLGRPWARTLSYTLGLSLGEQVSRTTTYVGSGLQPILTAREDGYYSVPWETTSYLASGGTESRPANVFAKVGNSFYVHTGPVRQAVKMGIEYRLDWNTGAGYRNDDDRHPLNPNYNGRPRAYSDLPALHQLSAYAEDAVRWELDDVRHVKLQAGLRLTSLQPWRDEATLALSPRLNASVALARWVEVRGGFGLNAKTPGMDYLYPDRKYADIPAANYMPQDGSPQMLIYQTHVYTVERSRGLKNATTAKVEAGTTLHMPWGATLDLLAYVDKTPKGFGTATEYVTYTNDLYAQPQIDALIAAGHTATTAPIAVEAPTDPLRHHLYYMTTGQVGNTNSTRNRGIEMDFDLGEVKALHTTFYLSGAYQETRTWSTDLASASVRTALLPTDYTAYGLTPFKVVYPSGLDHSEYRRWLNTLRVVTHIPALRMVASLTAQAVWYDWHHSYTADKEAVAWIADDGSGTGQTARHDITDAMRGGYIGLDGAYSPTAGIAIADLSTTYTDSDPTKNPVTWNVQARLTKELGKFGGLSLYVNNCLYYEPYMSNNKTTTLTQRNTGSFNFGAELYINL